MLRTYGYEPPDKQLFSFMPFGEQTVRQAYRKAIAQAEHYIYIEEQFPYMCDIAIEIGKQLKAKPDLKVIMVLASGTDIPGPLGAYSMHLRYEFLKALVGDEEFGDASRVYLYHLWQDPVTLASEDTKMIYVHTKLLLIDDRYAAIGSANLNKRSMTTDSELQIAILDSDTVIGDLELHPSPVKVCRFAQDLRRRLWTEHLGIESPVSFAEAFKEWPKWKRNSDEQKHHVKVLTPIEGKLFSVPGFTDMVLANFDPELPEWK